MPRRMYPLTLPLVVSTSAMLSPIWRIGPSSSTFGAGAGAQPFDDTAAAPIASPAAPAPIDWKNSRRLESMLCALLQMRQSRPTPAHGKNV